MPTVTQHIRAAQSFEQLAESLLNQSPSWAVVVTFYAALHWVDSFLARSQGIHPVSHSEREAYVRRTQLRLVFDQYKTLSDHSRHARYDLREFSADEARTLISTELSRIRAYVETPM